ncbi:MAG: glycosyltransferase family 9 protein, partial [Vicinamibacterales bacterium]|nr:glycosyltransferase family 9 protein [Vicinamibacterales bacterium]
FPGLGGLWAAARFLRRQRYDAALDLQGLIKSAALARASGARRVIGFAAGHLREPAARAFYGDTVEPAAGVHVVWKNMAVVRALGIVPAGLAFPLGASLDAAMAQALPPPDASGAGTFAVVNPGAGWPNKRWAPGRFGAVAAHLQATYGLSSLVTWGPGERELAEAVVRASGGAARCAPATGLGDLIALLGRARIFVGGDTGPLQLAAALGTPTVAVFGPTSPARNGSWSAEDISLTRFDTCECHHKRRCRRATPCIDDIEVGAVIDAVDRRLQARDLRLAAFGLSTVY